MVTPRRVIVEICNRPRVGAEDLARALGNFPIERTLATLGMLQRHGVVDVDGEGPAATVVSRYPHFEIAVQVAINAGLEVDKPIKSS